MSQRDARDEKSGPSTHSMNSPGYARDRQGRPSSPGLCPGQAGQAGSRAQLSRASRHVAAPSLGQDASLPFVVIGKGTQKWRAQTCITFQVITSGISPNTKPSSLFLRVSLFVDA